MVNTNYEYNQKSKLRKHHILPYLSAKIATISRIFSVTTKQVHARQYDTDNPHNTPSHAPMLTRVQQPASI